MRQSQLFGGTRREAPSGEESKNAILLTRGGYIDKELAGVYTLLPLGFRVAEKIKTIVREEMNMLPGSQELLMPALQAHQLWEESGRRDDIKEIMYDLQHETIGLGPTHEEVVTDLFRRFVSSYKDLPKVVYQIQTKFRREPRAKSGLLRGREFMMKDLYSFHETEEDLDRFYNLVKEAYYKIFERVGIEAILTEASGGVFSKYSHEFQVLAKGGEDEIYVAADGKTARNREIMKDTELVGKGMSAIEVGNIFKLNRKFSQPMHAIVANKEGSQTEVWTASYGIGITRLVGTLVEVYGDLEKGSILWPESVAPYRIHLIELSQGLGQEIYNDLIKVGLEVLYDDRDLTAGAKFADADLIGSPVRLVVSARTNEKESVELRIGRQEIRIVKQYELIKTLSQN